jgi:glycosyltransferase involved in cell wall biosynthesis
MPISSASSREPARRIGPVAQSGTTRPLLTVVVPVYNGGDEIVDNVEQIRRAVTAGLDAGSLEVIVVSDGSLDGTAERLLERRDDRAIRVIHYDRNLGKGYAVKLGALAARGDWVALVDSDLDVDPGSVPSYLEAARRERLDFAIGSKRHPDSVVHYPRSRRVASWLYQQLNRVLFHLDVRDTQVGLKVFSRDVVVDVVPLLLVKQFAFDLELLAVAKALGHGRVRELPVRLDYRFTGSMLGSSTVARALWDTVAIFYRLRVLRTYQRKRRLLGGGVRPAGEPPLVSLVGGADAAALDYANVEAVATAGQADGELVAVLSARARPAGNWLSATVPFFADPDVAAVVTPTVAPVRAPLRELVAAAVLESRLGGGSRRSSHFPGNVRVVSDYPVDSIVVRRSDYLAALADGIDGDELVAWLAARGRRTIYTPDTSLAAVPRPLVRPHLAATFRHARTRGLAAQRSRGGSLSAATAVSLAPGLAAGAGIVLVALGGARRTTGIALVLVYAGALAASGVHAGVRFRSAAVAVLEPMAVVASQVVYCGGFARGVSSSFSRASGSSVAQSNPRA